MHSISSGVEFIFRGGFMMYPLLISALVALAVILERIWVFHRIYYTAPDVVAQVFKDLRNHRFEQARDTCARTQTPVASVLAAGIEHFENPIEEMELSMKN